jgi:predicted DNA-binding protein with PD1-like motif
MAGRARGYSDPASDPRGRVVHIFRSDDGKAAFARIPRGSDLLRSLNELAAELGFEAATLQVVGAVETFHVAYYDQATHTYTPHPSDESHEVAGGVGNVSLKDGQPFVHIHLTGSDADGTIRNGHLIEGTRVFMIEAYLRKLDGPAPVREMDEDIGLPIWHA